MRKYWVVRRFTYLLASIGWIVRWLAATKATLGGSLHDRDAQLVLAGQCSLSRFHRSHSCAHVLAVPLQRILALADFGSRLHVNMKRLTCNSIAAMCYPSADNDLHTRRTFGLL